MSSNDILTSNNNSDRDNAGQKPKFKLFSAIQIGLGCFFGSTFAALLMLALNFRTVGDHRNFKVVLSVAVGHLPILIYFLLKMLDEGWYRIIIFIVAGGMTFIAEEWQGKIYKKHLDSGGEKKGSGSVIGAIALSLIIVFISTIIYLMLTDTDI